MSVELRWPGKYDALGRRTPIPRPGATLETLERWGEGEPRHRLVLGDNLAALDALAPALAGRVDLVYIDPPFATGGRFDLATRIGTGTHEHVSPAYEDRFEGGLAGFLAMLDPRIRLLHELLAAHGSFYVHVDPTVGHAVKLLCDEVFGPDGFQREIVWRIGWVSGFKTRARNWIRNHDLIFFYTKDPARFTFNKIYVPHPPGYRRRDGQPPRGIGVPIDDVWNANEAELALRGRDSLDSIQIKSFSTEKSGFATQKNESLLRRIIAASSNPGDLVLDAFCGSGTTGVAAAELGRWFVGCDVNAAALHVAKKRILEAADQPGAAEAGGGRRSGVEVCRVASGDRGPREARPGPAVELRVDSEAGVHWIALCGYCHDDPEWLPEDVRGALETWSDVIDAWWIARDDDPPCIVAHAFRTHQKRALALRLAVPHTVPSRWLVRVTDVMHRTTDVRIEIGSSSSVRIIAVA